MKLEKEKKIFEKIDYVYLGIIGFLLVNVLAMYISPRPEPEPVTINHLAMAANGTDLIPADESVAQADQSFSTVAEVQNRMASKSVTTSSSVNTSSSTSSKPKKITPGEAKININKAGILELQRLPGIGEGLSARIVAYRIENGPFTSIQDLTNVSGIGAKTLTKFAQYITI
ncbi:ComEA family DNA-binding protein [Treponema sp. R6D11]